MNSDRPSNESASARTHESGQNGHSAKASEADILAEQAAEAQAALKSAVEDLTKSLKASADPIAWTKRYPIASLGVAAVAGFTAAKLVMPSHQPQGIPPGYQAYAGPATNGSAAPAGPQRPGIMSWLMATFGDVIKDSVQAAIMAHVATSATQDDGGQAADGQHSNGAAARGQKQAAGPS